MKTFSQAPYYDDFQESKNFYQILFKPGKAVQARELTQLQTIIRKQVERFGSHVFEDGSLVHGGEITYYDTTFIDVERNGLDFLQQSSGEIVGGTSGAKANLIHTQVFDETIRLHVMMKTSKTRFSRGESVVLADSTVLRIKDSENFTGGSNVCSVSESVFFIRGSFVHTDEQRISYLTDSVSTTLIGFEVSEEIVDFIADESLLDNARGYSNYTANGADRYTIFLTLKSVITSSRTNTSDDGSANTLSEDSFEDFIELVRFDGKSKIREVNRTIYNELGKELARRTYDESGDYTVTPFSIEILEHRNNDPDKLSIKIYPGKAYVKGYEFETISPIYKDLNRSRETITTTGSITQIDYGKYFYVTNVSGYIEYNSNKKIEIYGSSPEVLIGTCNIYGIEHVSEGIYKLFVFNTKLEDGITNWSGASSITDDLSTPEWTCDIREDSYSSDSIDKLIIDVPSANTPIIQLQDNNIKTFYVENDGANTDTQVIVNKTFTGTFSDVSTEIDPYIVTTLNTGSANVQFITNDPDEWIVIDPVTGTQHTVLSVVGSGQTRTVEIGSPLLNGKIFTKIAFTQATEKTKTLASGSRTDVSFSNEPEESVSLGVADCVKTDLKITGKSSTNTSVNVGEDLSSYFNFDSGQRDDLYDHGKITLKPGKQIPSQYDLLDIEFKYYEHSSFDGYFSSDSYPSFSDIPDYKTSKGIVYKLSGCLDFRPVRAPGVGVTQISNSTKVVNDTTISADYEYYLGRKDRLAVTNQRKFKVIEGSSGVTPSIPSEDPDSMTLYTINIPPYTKDPKSVSFTYIDNRRYTMRDIGAIDKRIKRIEYYTALSLLEKQAREDSFESTVPGIERFKNGILVDSFAGHNTGNVGNPDYMCSIDKAKHILRPAKYSFSHGFQVSSSENLDKIKLERELLHLPYTVKPFIVQNNVTNWVNCNPYLVFKWSGKIELSPPSDVWVATEEPVRVVSNINGSNDAFTILRDPSADIEYTSNNTYWNDWQQVIRGAITGIENQYDSEFTTNLTTLADDSNVIESNIKISNTQTVDTVDSELRTGLDFLQSNVNTIENDLGVKVVDASLIPYVRSRTVVFKAIGLKPNTDLFATFDDVNVSEYCSKATELVISGLSEAFEGSSFEGNVPRMVRDDSRITSCIAEVLMVYKDRVWIRPSIESTDSFQVGSRLNWKYAPSESSTDPDWFDGGTVVQINQSTDLGELTTNDGGEICGFFTIPNPNRAGNPKFNVGELLFRLSNTLSKSVGIETEAEISYNASGMSMSRQQDIISTRIQEATIRSTLETSSSDNTTSREETLIDAETSITIPPPKIVVGCGETYSSKPDVTSINLENGFEFEILLGTDTGAYEIVFTNTSSSQIPFKPILYYAGNEYDLGWIGDENSVENLDTIRSGAEVTTTNSERILPINKTTSESRAILYIDSPYENSKWSFEVLCNVEGYEKSPSYSITSNKFVATENDTITFTIDTDNLVYDDSVNGIGYVNDEETLYWRPTGNGTATQDYFSNTISGSSVVTVDENGKATFSLSTVGDFGVLPSATLEMGLYTDPTDDSSLVASTQLISIGDELYAVIEPILNEIGSDGHKILNTSFQEGEDIFFRIWGKGLEVGDVIKWEATGEPTTLPLSKVTSGVLEGTITVAEGNIIEDQYYNEFTIQTNLDALTEESDYLLTLELYIEETPGNFVKISTAPTVTITDQSQPLGDYNINAKASGPGILTFDPAIIPGESTELLGSSYSGRGLDGKYVNYFVESLRMKETIQTWWESPARNSNAIYKLKSVTCNDDRVKVFAEKQDYSYTVGPDIINGFGPGHITHGRIGTGQPLSLTPIEGVMFSPSTATTLGVPDYYLDWKWSEYGLDPSFCPAQSDEDLHKLQTANDSFVGRQMALYAVYRLEKPIEMSSDNFNSLNIEKRANDPYDIHIVFNPHRNSDKDFIAYIKTTEYYFDRTLPGNSNYELLTRINDWEDVGNAGIYVNAHLKPIPIELTFTWEYVSGDESIPASQRTITTTKSAEISYNIDYYPRLDPIAQTFYIDPEKYPNGLFLKEMDLFFRTKSETMPIEVQIRPVVNGYPSSKTILPFGRSQKEASNVNVSSDGSIATRFKFPNIIHLSPGTEYCFVAITNSDEYEVFTSVIGEYSLNNSTQRVSGQSTLGSMFKSQNASTWTAVQEEDVKFALYQARFPQNQSGSAILDTNVSDLDSKKKRYDVFFCDGETISFTPTRTQFAVKPFGVANFSGYQLGSNVTLSEPNYIKRNDPETLQMSVELETSDPNVTPVVDLSRLASVFTGNIINNDVTNELESFGGEAKAKYITRTVQLAPGFESTDIAVYLDAKRPQGTDVKVYYKVGLPNDNEVFDENPYYEMQLDTTYSERASSSEFKEYKYKTGYNFNLDPAIQQGYGSSPSDTIDNNDTFVESAALPNGEKFDSFVIKIVMLSDSTNRVPEIRNLRAIALDE